MTFVRSIRAAFIFLTRIPLGGFPYSRAEWRWSSAHFPLVGLVLGALLGAFWQLGYPWLGPWLTACFVTACSMLLTGAFHEDGLADTADALGGAYDRENILRILKDSRVGSFGAAALCLALIWRVAALAQLGHWGLPALICTQSWARLGPILLMRLLPYVSDDDAAKSRRVSRAGWPQVGIAFGWSLLAGIILLALYPGIAPMLMLCALLIIVITLLCLWRFRARLGGITGDFLGAAEQLGECAGLSSFTIAQQFYD